MAERHFSVGAGPGGATSSSPRFDFLRDTLAFANETKWRYEVDPQTGRQISTRRLPEPDYVLRCFSVARATRLFWQHARFQSHETRLGLEDTRQRIRSVLVRSLHGESQSSSRVTIPGYSGLREFSAAEERLLKAECGGPWRSYFQRGNWRMVLPFTRRHQAREAARASAALASGRLPIIHVLRFPQLTINHALLLFAVDESMDRIEFRAYDPNISEAELRMTFDRATRTFSLPPLAYFAGGRVDVYEIYRGGVY